MMIRVLKHTKIGTQSLMMGDQLTLSVFDKILDDGRLIYHIDHGQTYIIIPAELFKVVYSSFDEMQSFVDAPKYVKDLKKELERLTEDNRALRQKILEIEDVAIRKLNGEEE